jgi:MYXO-CTERM domain-containing protein
MRAEVQRSRRQVGVAGTVVVVVLAAAQLASAQDAGDPDGGAPDAGLVDAGSTDAGPDGGLVDAGDLDGGADAGPDGGFVDGGPLDAGVVDAGPMRPPGEGFSCDPLAPDCQGDLICVPYPGFPEFGTCRASCADDENSCFTGRTCQTLVDGQTLRETDEVCTWPTTWRDGDCMAPGDPDACADPYECRLGSAPVGGINRAPAGIYCKLGCDLEAADAGYPEARVACDFTSCSNGGACACDEAGGFTCAQLSDGSAFCASVPGECGAPTRGMEPGDIDDAGFLSFEVQCNPASGHRFCDNEPFEGLDNPGANLCFFQGQLGVPDEGLCLPFCGTVDVDINNNGTIEATEEGQLFDCPADKVCTPRLGRELFVGPSPQALGGPYNSRGCQVADCPPEQPCASCGPGQTECLELQDPVAGYTGICIGPLLTCEHGDGWVPPPPPEEDAGVSDDAGAADVDAGSDDPPPGPGLTPGGPGGIERQGSCDCAASETSGETGPAGLISVALLSLLLRRRRR